MGARGQPPPDAQVSRRADPTSSSAEVEAALVEAAAVTAPFALALHGLGAFPGLERPRILWVGIADGALPAREVQARVETALERRGIPRERQAWHPHLTIGRVFDERAWRREAGLPLRQALAAAARRSFGTLAVSHIALMRSDLSPQGARYRELASAELRPPSIPAVRDSRQLAAVRLVLARPI